MDNFIHDDDIEKIIDLASNINFIKPDLNINLNKIKINSYPTYDSLYSTLSKHFNVDVNMLELFNGDSSAIFSMMRHLPNNNCYIYSPASLEYKKAAIKTNKNVELINRFIDLDHEIEKNSIVVFANPSVPDGTLYDMDTLLEYWNKKSCVTIIDESFLEFTNAVSLSNYLDKYKNLYIIKSMTNFYGCPGIRIGCVLSRQYNISQLKAKEPSWKLSQFDSLYMQALLEDKKFRKISLAVNAKAKADLEKTIKEFDKFFEQVVHSNANFILVRLKRMTPKQFQEKLKVHKIMIKNCSDFDFMNDEYIRISVKSQKEMAYFAKAIKNIVSLELK